MEKIRVLVCDDMFYMSMFFKDLLNSTESCECVGEAHDEKDVIDKVSKLKPDVILLDVQLENSESGIMLIPQILEISPDSDIIMISIHDDNDKIFKAIQLGAKDYILKSQPPSEIVKSIEKIRGGSKELRVDIGKRIIDQIEVIEERQKSLLYIVNKIITLSSREVEVLKAACHGYNYEEIAKKIKIEEVTVRTYISRILKKMHYTKMTSLIDDLNMLGVMDLLANLDKKS